MADFSYKSSVPGNHTGKSLLVYLCERFPYHSKEDWLDLILNTRVFINGNLPTKDQILTVGDVVEYSPIPGKILEPEVDTRFGILWEEEDLLFVNKPGNLPVHPSGRYRTQTLWNFLEKEYPGIQAVHRLDRETSGVILYGKNPEITKILQKSFEKRLVEKEYLTIVFGQIKEPFTLEGFLLRDKTSEVRKKMCFRAEEEVGDAQGKRVITNFLPLAYDSVSDLSLVKIVPITGRIHQIRASLLYAGFPILGDKLYGKRERAFLDFIHFGFTEDLKSELKTERQLLHAYRLRIPDPSSGRIFDITAPIPDDFLFHFPNAKTYVT